MVVLGNEEQEINIFREAHDKCLSLTCPVCMTECRALAYLAINLIKLRAGMVSEKELENDEMFNQAVLYILAFIDSHKDLVQKINGKGIIIKEEETRTAKEEDGKFVELKEKEEVVIHG